MSRGTTSNDRIKLLVDATCAPAMRAIVRTLTRAEPPDRDPVAVLRVGGRTCGGGAA